jgi:uncharacterized Zn finger protein (UPF0148 family)
MAKKCKSCRCSFFHYSGYTPCSCKSEKAVYAKELTSQEISDFKEKIKQELKENPLYSKRMNIEAKPEFMPPPSVEFPENNDGDFVETTNQRDVVLFISLALNLAFATCLGCIYATSHLS